jgi:hypothetical protein
MGDGRGRGTNRLFGGHLIFGGGIGRACIHLKKKIQLGSKFLLFLVVNGGERDTRSRRKNRGSFYPDSRDNSLQRPSGLTSLNFQRTPSKFSGWTQSQLFRKPTSYVVLSMYTQKKQFQLLKLYQLVTFVSHSSTTGIRNIVKLFPAVHKALGVVKMSPVTLRAGSICDDPRGDCSAVQ